MPVVFFFFLPNIYLAISPYVPPDAGESVYKDRPYYLHCVVVIGIFAVGALYYIGWAVVQPRIGKYTLVKETVVGSDGWSRGVCVRVPERKVAESAQVMEATISDFSFPFFFVFLVHM
jgi:hypothetical protein